ncbi:MAG: protein kinase [Candidatus Hermodarchaeota archaeon]
MNKPCGLAEIYNVYSKEDNIVRVAKVYDEPLGRINEDVYLSDAKKLMNIDHENVVKIMDKGIIEYEEEKYFFLIMELIRGKSFEEIDDRIFFERPYTERLGYFVQALNGVNEFRDKFELHRDLHAGNVMLTDEDINKERKIKIIDPGSSRYSYEPEDEDVDLFYIKEGFINMFLRPEEITGINEKVKLDDLTFPEFRKFIEELSEEEERKFQSEQTNHEGESADADYVVDQLNEELGIIHQEISSIDPNRKHLDFSFFAVPISLHPKKIDFDDETTINILKDIHNNLIYRSPDGGVCDFDNFLREFKFRKDWYQSNYTLNGNMVFNFGRTKIYKKGIISMTIAVDASPVEDIQNSIFLLKKNEKTLNSLWINANLLAYLIMMWLKLVRSIYTKLDFQGSIKLILDVYSGWDLSLVGGRTLLLGNDINPRSEITVKISDLNDNEKVLKTIQSILKELLRFFNVDIDEFERGYELFRGTIEEYFSVVFK